MTDWAVNDVRLRWASVQLKKPIPSSLVLCRDNIHREENFVVFVGNSNNNRQDMGRTKERDSGK